MKKLLLVLVLFLLIPALAHGQTWGNVNANKLNLAGNAGADFTNFYTFTTPSMAAPLTLTWPAAYAGSAGMVLSSTTTGGLSWVAASSGTVTSITAGTGLTGGTITSSGTIALAIPVVIANGGTNSITALSGNSIMISNGSAIVQGAAGTTTTLLHGNASGSPTYSAVSLTADVTGILPLANGGTNANLTASTGGIFYSGASAGAILAGTTTANQILMSGASAAPAWSTATYPATTTANDLLYSSATNTVGQITTANNEILVTNGSGVPAWSTTLPSAVTGYVSSVTNSDGTLTISPTSGAVIASLALGHANTWTNTQTINATIIHGDATIYTAQSPTAISGTVTNQALPTQTFVYLSATAAATIDGMTAGVDGQTIIIRNPSAFAITLVDQSASATGKRFLFSNVAGGSASYNIVLLPQSSVILMYDATNSFNSITGYWIPVAHY